MEYWNDGENKTTGGYSSWSHVTQHSIIPVFQHSRSPRVVLLDSGFRLLTPVFAGLHMTAAVFI